MYVCIVNVRNNVKNTSKTFRPKQLRPSSVIYRRQFVYFVRRGEIIKDIKLQTALNSSTS